VNNDFNDHLEESLKKLSDFGDGGLNSWFSHEWSREIQLQEMNAQDIEVEEMRDHVMNAQETVNNICLSNDLPDGLLKGNLSWSSMDDTPSLAFENDYLLSDIDDGSMETWQNMRKFRRNLQRQMMMLAKLTNEEEELLKREGRFRRTSQPDYYKNSASGSKFNSSRGIQNLYPPLWMSAGGLLPPMSSGKEHSFEKNTLLPPREGNYAGQSGYVQAEGGAKGLLDETLKRQWCTKRKNGSFLMSRMALKSQLQVHRRPPQPPRDDHYKPLLEHLLVKVRNIHPTPSLHELHVQHPEVFGKKPIFTSIEYGYNNQRRKCFAVTCQFEFKGSKLYVQETAPTKSDAKLNAARAMIRKLKNNANVSITLKEESIRAAVDKSLEHPRCRLLHLHDSWPDIYPQQPIFKTIKSCGVVSKSRYTNMICFFQVGTDKLTTVGTAHNKKQAIVQAARNMLQLLASSNYNDKYNQHKVEYTPPDRSQSPWTCHLCKIFMTGRKPFLSHLKGRCHLQRLSELGLNVEEENRVLQELAEKAFEKEEQRRAVASKNANMNMKRAHRYKVQELQAERERKNNPSPSRSQSSKYQRFHGLSSDRHSEEDSEKSDMIIGSSSNSSSQSYSSIQ